MHQKPLTYQVKCQLSQILAGNFFIRYGNIATSVTSYLSQFMIDNYECLQF